MGLTAECSESLRSGMEKLRAVEGFREGHQRSG